MQGLSELCTTFLHHVRRMLVLLALLLPLCTRRTNGVSCLARRRARPLQPRLGRRETRLREAAVARAVAVLELTSRRCAVATVSG